MPLSTSTLPNKALNGAELLEVAVQKFRQAMESDCMFARHIAYGRVSFTISATFHVANGNIQPFTVRTRAQKEGAIEGEVPLKDAPDGELVSLETKDSIDNPNQERVAAGLPIRVDGRKTTGPATPGDPFPAIETKEYRYDASSAPPPHPVVVTDVSEREAAKHGAKARKFKSTSPRWSNGGDKDRGSMMDPNELIPSGSVDKIDELDAISEEAPE